MNKKDGKIVPGNIYPVGGFYLHTDYFATDDVCRITNGIALVLSVINGSSHEMDQINYPYLVLINGKIGYVNEFHLKQLL